MTRLRSILVVEDSDEDFDTVQDAAKRCGLRHLIVRARSGAEGLRLLEGRAGRIDAPLALILLDLNTPGDDGRDVLRDLRSHVGPGQVPLVVLSASASARDLEFCYANGVNAYHVKSVDHALHLRVLQDIFAYWLGSVVLPA